MISSRTVYLRKKNEELLNALKEDGVRLNKKLRECKDLLRKNPEQYDKDDYSQRHRHHSPEIMSPIAPNSNQSGAATNTALSQPMKARRRPGHSPPMRIRSSSVDRHPRRTRHSACVPSRPASHSSSEVRWSRLQQELASQAHMHGYTMSHSLSKCYCTRGEGSASCENVSERTKASDATSIKANIPQRLKDKRYQPDAPKHRPNSVKWAVPSDEDHDRLLVDESCGIDLPLDDFKVENEPKSPRSVCIPSVGEGDGPNVETQRHAPMNRTQYKPMKATASVDDETPSESDSDWFAKMRNFRKSNWEDCHAPDRGRGDQNDCKCTRLFTFGERMFLEPLRKSDVDKRHCCSSKSCENASPPSPRENVVTLPKVPLETRERDLGKRKDGDSFVLNPRREDRFLRPYNINKPCFLTGHKTETNESKRAILQRRPADSFALRYQKGVDPRAP